MVLHNKMQLVAALVLLMGIAQVYGISLPYHCKAINVCDDTVDAKWTQHAVEDTFGKYGAKVAYNWKPATTSGCLAKKCNTPVTVTFKASYISADVTLLDEAVAQTIKTPALLSKKAVCVEDATAAFVKADPSCRPSGQVPVGSVLCRSAQVCSNFEDFKWVEVEASKAITAFLKKNGLSTSGITVAPAKSVPGCTCKSPATITVTAKVPSKSNFAAVDSALAATLAALAGPLKAACSADATAAYLAAHPICTKPTPTAPTKKAAATVCRDVDLCDNAVDFAWTKIVAEDAFEPLFKALKVPQDAAHFTVTKLKGTSLKAGSVACTCKTRAQIKIVVPAAGNAAAKVDAFIAKVKASLDTVQCLASAVSKTCTQPPVGKVTTCAAWTLVDDNADWPWTVNTVKKALAPCFASTKTATSGLSIARESATCATLGATKCCGKNVATVKVKGIATDAFTICARAALTVANLGKPFKCSGAARC